MHAAYFCTHQGLEFLYPQTDFSSFYSPQRVQLLSFNGNVLRFSESSGGSLPEGLINALRQVFGVQNQPGPHVQETERNEAENRLRTTHADAERSVDSSEDGDDADGFDSGFPALPLDDFDDEDDALFSSLEEAIGARSDDNEIGAIGGAQCTVNHITLHAAYHETLLMHLPMLQRLDDIRVAPVSHAPFFPLHCFH